MRSMFATAVGLFVLFAGLAKAETPSTQPNGLAPAGLTEVIRLWPNDPPAKRIGFRFQWCLFPYRLHLLPPALYVLRPCATG